MGKVATRKIDKKPKGRFWMYVLVSVDAKQLDEEGPGAISFRHIIVHARNEEEAYDVGFGKMVAHFGAAKSPDIVFNDYVIPLGAE